MSQKRENSFPENTFGRNRYCCTKISGFWVQNILSDVPNSAKLISRKHVWPKSALLHKDFRVLGPKYSVGCPKFGKTHFPKTRLAEIGTVAQRFPGFGSKIFCRMSRIWQNSFPENTFGRKWDINRTSLPPNGDKCAFFLLEDFG
uniref:Uncharacterized protein n=1 Tax=viral metagenome TaxID=1070528 RepID=A0A6C0I4U3_9ZZZZ